MTRQPPNIKPGFVDMHRDAIIALIALKKRPAEIAIALGLPVGGARHVYRVAEQAGLKIPQGPEPAYLDRARAELARLRGMTA